MSPLQHKHVIHTHSNMLASLSQTHSLELALGSLKRVEMSNVMFESLT